MPIDQKKINHGNQPNPTQPTKSFSINPVVGTVIVAIIGLVGTGIGASIGGYYSIKLEKEKLRSSLILKAVETTDPNSALNYLKLLQNTGLVTDLDVTIEEWTDNPEAVPLRPNLSQIALEEMDDSDKDVRIASTDKLIAEEASNPAMIRDVLTSLREPKTADGLWNNIVFLNATKKEAYDADLIQFAIDEIKAFENNVQQNKLTVGPATKKSLEKYKVYLGAIQKQL